MKRIITILFFTTAFFTNFSLVQAAQINLQGYAWSDVPQNNAVDRGAGWVKFNGPGYVVNMDSSTGALSGYAWSENYGWLSFQSADVAGCPTAPCAPTVNLSTGAVSGWARFLAAPSSGTWTGWVHLNPSNGGVSYNLASAQFSGDAWGDSDIGWVEFCGAWTPDCVATAGTAAAISVAVTPAALASQVNWQINPGAINGTGNGNESVFPTGVPYCLTVTSANPSGYNSPTISVVVNGTTYNSNCTPPLTGGENVSFTVAYSAAFNYSLSPNPASISIEQGFSDFVGIVKTLTSGTSQAVNIFVDQVDGNSTLPGWFGYSLANDGCSPNCTTTIQINPQTNQGGVGTHTITVRGTSAGTPDKFTSFQLTVNPQQIISCTVTPTPASGIKTYDNVTWSATISGGSNIYTDTWSFNPAPTSTPIINSSGNASFAQIPGGYGDPGLKTASLHVVDSQGRQTNPDCSANILVKPRATFIEE